ncbi:MAG: bifunctional glutamate N-acetyltransferase/amino-acid acetyltransferase ArgJ [bacterium]
MVVGVVSSAEIFPVAGVRLATAASGIRYEDRDDTVLIELAPGTHTAAVFTQNVFCAAPVHVAKKHLDAASPRFLLINSGNANAGTGSQGMGAAERSCDIVASSAGVSSVEVLPFSTGVIGEALAVEKFVTTMPRLIETLDDDCWLEAARGIMTTDTVPKVFSRRVQLSGRTVVITGISKGAGMICPNMATMLSYVATDAGVESSLLDKLLRAAVTDSFNSITVDGDTSTNDSCVLMATGASGVEVESAGDVETFAKALNGVMQDLAKAIIRDAEGVTKFITLKVRGAQSHEQAKTVAYTVAHSPLVKTAFFASDANWGRILAAIGRAPVQGLDVSLISIALGDVLVVQGGEPAPGYSEAKGAAVMAKEEVTVTITLGLGDGAATVWTSDLSHDYVSINADYRS